MFLLVAITITQAIGKNTIAFYHVNINCIKMSDTFKNTAIKNRIYNFFDDMINIKNLDLDKIEINKNSYKNILIYNIGYVMVKYLRDIKLIA